MTWSIIACDDEACGAAVASRFFAVGALCSRACGGVGALSTQALVNPLYAAPALEAMARGEPPSDIVARLAAADAGGDHRQLHLIDAKGRIGAHTGAACIEWCGHRAGFKYSVAGNMLAGPQVLEATAHAFEMSAGRPLGERLIAALIAGEAVGGDRRGKQAAALVVCTTETYPALDLRVDDHPEPLRELSRLYDKSLERFQPFVACLPTATQPAGTCDRAAIEEAIERFQRARAER